MFGRIYNDLYDLQPNRAHTGHLPTIGTFQVKSYSQTQLKPVQFNSSLRIKLQIYGQTKIRRSTDFTWKSYSSLRIKLRFRRSTSDLDFKTQIQLNSKTQIKSKFNFKLIKLNSKIISMLLIFYNIHTYIHTYPL